MNNKKPIEHYFENAKDSTSIGEHLYILNLLLFEVVKNTAPEIINKEDKNLLNSLQ